MVLVFSEKDGPRWRYAAKAVISDFLGLECQCSTDQIEYQNWDGPKISYGKAESGSGLSVPADGFLFRTGVKPIEPELKKEGDLPLLFPSKGPFDLSFDVFSAAFYLLSRYEEYLPFRSDEHGRFPLTESFLFKHKLHQRPLVDEYALFLEGELRKRFPAMGESRRKYSYLSTIDIDNAWAFLHKGPVRFLGGLVQSLSQGRLYEFRQRWRVVLGREADPYYCYQKLNLIQDQYEIPVHYFFLLGNYGEYDKNVPHTSIPLQELIKDMGDRARIGLHPSYASNSVPGLLSEEKKRLEEILNREVIASRQHFLKLNLPSSCRRLIDLGIKEDYSMGFIEAPSFRAGAYSPFYFYDLDREQSTRLRLFPFQMIDTGFRFYQGFESPEKAMEALRPVLESVKRVKGKFISVFHNESPSGYGPWQGWGGFYESVVKAAKPMGND
jgi:hypothetical protein